jgi:hypothetical protein
MEVSARSPLGEALVRARVGEQVTVNAKRGTLRYEILELDPQTTEDEAAKLIANLTSPDHLWSRAEALDKLIDENGIYGWYFDDCSMLDKDLVDARRCAMFDGSVLLYVGKAVCGEKGAGGLRDRICDKHYGGRNYRGNFGSSTLRWTLASLLFPPPKPFDERLLSEWMASHARVVPVRHEKAKQVEAKIIKGLYLPLNIDDNEQESLQAWIAKLGGLRKEFKRYNS